MKRRTIENLCTVLMIILTLFVSSYCSMTDENWTVLLLRPEKKLLYVFGTLGSTLFCFLLYQLSKRVKKPQRALCFMTMMCMPLSLMFVYDPDVHQMETTLHLLFAYLYFFGINASIIISLFQLHFRNTKLFHHLAQLYGLILAGCAAICMHYMVINTLFELYFTCATTCFISYSLHRLEE